LLGGVAAGLAEYFAVDVALVRLLWLLFVFAGGAAVPAYIIAWIVIPQEPEGTTVREEAAFSGPKRSHGALEQRRKLAGIILVVVGGVFLLDLTVDIMSSLFTRWWPLLVAAVGVYLLYDASRGRE